MKNKNWEIHYRNKKAKVRKCNKKEAFKGLLQDNVSYIVKTKGLFKRTLFNSNGYLE